MRVHFCSDVCSQAAQAYGMRVIHALLNNGYVEKTLNGLEARIARYAYVKNNIRFLISIDGTLMVINNDTGGIRCKATYGDSEEFQDLLKFETFEQIIQYDERKRIEILLSKL